jgi:hypothetical protein
LQHVADQGGFAGTKKAGNNGGRDFGRHAYIPLSDGQL